MLPLLSLRSRVSSAAASQRSRKTLRLMLGLALMCTTTFAIVFVVFGQHTKRTRTLTRLDRELALATEAKDAGSVREIARRLGTADASGEREVRLAEVFLALGMLPELEALIARMEQRAVERPRVVDRLRAQAAGAKGDWELAIASWTAFVDATGSIAVEHRAAALDELTSLLVRTGQWQKARQRLDERLALSESPAVRLARATVHVRTREWSAAAEDFLHLRQTASSFSEVKANLPRWERVERALRELSSCDDAVKNDPAGVGPRIERALASARAGLWQNAAEDLAFAIERAPELRLPMLLWWRLAESIDRTRVFRAGELSVNALPCFAPTDAVNALAAEMTEQHENWRLLAACDLELVAAKVGESRLALLTEQARLECAMGAVAQALADVKRVRESAPDFLPAQRVEIAALLAQGAFVIAGERVAISLREHPDDLELNRLAGLVWQQQGKHERAIDAFSVWLATRRTPEILRARAKSLRFLQRFDLAADDVAAAEILERAARQTP